jgi:hypothetical protein
MKPEAVERRVGSRGGASETGRFAVISVSFRCVGEADLPWGGRPVAGQGERGRICWSGTGMFRSLSVSTTYVCRVPVAKAAVGWPRPDKESYLCGAGPAAGRTSGGTSRARGEEQWPKWGKAQARGRGGAYVAGRSLR